MDRIATQIFSIILSIGISFSLRVFLPPTFLPLSHPPSPPGQLETDQRKLCFRLQIPFLSVGFQTKYLIILSAQRSRSVVKYSHEGSADQQLSTILGFLKKCNTEIYIVISEHRGFYSPIYLVADSISSGLVLFSGPVPSALSGRQKLGNLFFYCQILLFLMFILYKI